MYEADKRRLQIVDKNVGVRDWSMEGGVERDWSNWIVEQDLPVNDFAAK